MQLVLVLCLAAGQYWALSNRLYCFLVWCAWRWGVARGRS